MKKIFEGVGVAIVTPFNNGKIDYISFQNLIEHTIASGSDAIIILGTTGESCTISKTERTEIIKFCKKIINNRVSLIVGTGNNNFETCFLNSLEAKFLGADACLVVTPYYNKTSQQGIIKYYSELAKIKIPLIIYNVPTRTGLNIELDTLKKIISTNKYVYGIKECCSNANRLVELMQICKNKIAVYSGEDCLNYVYYTLGASGTISVTANAFCSQVKKVFTYFQKKEFDKSLKQQNKLSSINQLMFVETNPMPVKYFLKNLKLINSCETRLPLIELNKNNKGKIKKYLKNIKKL